MRAIRVEDAPIARKVEGFEGRRLSDGPPATVVHIRMERGAVLEPHPAPADTAFFVVEGEGVVSSGGKEVRAERGTLVEAPKGSSNGLRNTGGGPFVVLVIRGGE